MTKSKQTDPGRRALTHLRRRELLGALGAGGAMVLVGCGDDGGTATDSDATTGTGSTGGTSSTGVDPTTGDGTSGTTDATTGGTTDATTGGPTTTESSETTGEPTSTGETTGADVECEGPARTWASGGTVAMTAKDCYPDPFAGGIVGCPLMCETTAGPCTADTVDRQDVSEGLPGLPVRLALLVVTADTCEPIAGARVQIWHTQRRGIYSGETPAGQMCYGDDPDAENHLYFRGLQTTDAEGRVDFDTCYPGWYGGRAIHIHFRVDIGDDAYIVSQLFFADALNEEIFATHPDYTEFGQPDTPNDEDNILGGANNLPNYVLETARMPDGAMLASKVLAIRASLGDPSCQL